MAGFAVSKDGLNTQIGLEVGNLSAALAACRTRLAWLNDTNVVPSTFLQTTLGYTAGEESTIRTAFADLDSLAQIAHGIGTKGVATIGSSAAANNFFFTAKLLGGPNYYG